MNVNECIKYVEDHMEIRYATNNGAYKAGKTIKPIGCVNHSVGVAQPSADVMYNKMNVSSASWGVNAILGDFHLGEGKVIVCLKDYTRPWGCGSGSKGSWNNSKIQWEVCEPSGHSYSGGTMIGYDVAKNQAYFDRMWKLLVAWNVYCIKKYGYDVSGISDHSEAHKAGYGSNHSDMGQWLPKHGKSMDALRAEVKAILSSGASSYPIPPTPPSSNSTSGDTPFKVKVSITDLNIRTGPGTNYTRIKYIEPGIFTIAEVKPGTGSKAGWGRLKSGAGWISLDFTTRV